MLKILSGSLKGRYIKAPKDIRPATSFLKAAIFNIIGPSIENSCFLDMFAGSGAMGIEAISRGANKAYFIDSSNISCRFIKNNLRDLKIENQAVVYQKDALQSLALLKEKFHFITVDPPFIFFEKKPEFINSLLKTMVEYNLLNPESIIFLEEPTYSKRNIEIDGLKIKDKRKFSSANLIQYTL